MFSFNNKEYKSCGTFSEGFLPVVKEDQVIYLNKEGKKAYELCNIADSTGYLVYFCQYNENRSVFCEGETFGLKDKDNNIILRAKYDYLSYIGDDKYIASQDHKYGIIDHEDNHLIDFKYDDITKMNDDVLLVRSGKTYTLINMKGEDLTNYNFSSYSLASYHFVKSNYIDPKEYALKIFKSFDENSCRGYNGSMTVEDFMNELEYSASYYTDEYSIVTNGRDDSNKPCAIGFEGPISSRTYKYESLYYFSYKVPNGYAFNKKTKIRMIINLYDISDYEIVEDKVCKEFDNLLKNKGYNSLEDNLFVSPKGTVVGLGYENGKLSLYYYFTKGRYIDIKRELRTKRAKQTPEGMPKDETAEEEVIDSVAVIE